MAMSFGFSERNTPACPIHRLSQNLIPKQPGGKNRADSKLCNCEGSEWLNGLRMDGTLTGGLLVWAWLYENSKMSRSLEQGPVLCPPPPHTCPPMSVCLMESKSLPMYLCKWQMKDLIHKNLGDGNMSTGWTPWFTPQVFQFCVCDPMTFHLDRTWFKELSVRDSRMISMAEFFHNFFGFEFWGIHVKHYCELNFQNHLPLIDTTKKAHQTFATMLICFLWKDTFQCWGLNERHADYGLDFLVSAGTFGTMRWITSAGL